MSPLSPGKKAKKKLLDLSAVSSFLSQQMPVKLQRKPQVVKNVPFLFASLSQEKKLKKSIV